MTRSVHGHADRQRAGEGWLARQTTGRKVPPRELAAQAEASDERLVTGEIPVTQVVEQAATLADHDNQSPAGVVIALVTLEMRGQRLDALRQQGHLDLHRTRILLVLLIFLFNFRFY